MEKIILYRFEKGDLAGHNFGNLFLAALEKVSDDYNQAIELASYVLQTKGKVIPVTLDKLQIVAEYENGKKIIGEALIDENFSESTRIKNIYLEPKGTVNNKAISAIKESDFIIIGPGDLYTSIIPVLIVDGVSQSIMNSKAKIIYIMNLMTKSGQTTHYKASDHINDLEKYLGRNPDYILINNSKIPDNILKWYKKYNEVKVVNNLTKNSFKIYSGDLIDNEKIKKNPSDLLYRSILRHNSSKLAKVLNSIFKNA